MRDDLVEQLLRLCNAFIHPVFPSFSVASEICGPGQVAAASFLPLRGHTRTKSPALMTVKHGAHRSYYNGTLVRATARKPDITLITSIVATMRAGPTKTHHLFEIEVLRLALFSISKR